MTKRKIYGIVLALVMAVSMLPKTVIEAQATQSMAARYNRTYKLTGNKAADIVTAALAQKEKKKADLGYSEAWCADFIGDSAYLVGASDVIPANGKVATLYANVLAANGTEVFVPQMGDLVFYYCTSTQTWVHVGIMVDSVQSIEGNYSGKVSLVKGVYRDSHGHSLANGTVVRKFIRPAYYRSKASAPKVISNNTTINPGTNTNTSTKTDTDKKTDTKTDTDKKTDTKTDTDKKTDTKKDTAKKTDKDTKKDTGKKTDKSTKIDTSKKTNKSTKKPSTKKTTKETSKSTVKLSKKYAGTYKVNTKDDPLTMRLEPDKTSDVVIQVPKGTKVKVIKGTKDWAYTTYKGLKGYLSMEFLNKVSK